jgi:hypothetical protein
MTEKTPSSVIMGKRREEMTWMPEKARGNRSGEWRVIFRLTGKAAGELELVVEEEKARGFASLDGERGKGVIFCVELEHAADVDGADDIDIVQEKGLRKRVASGEWRVASGEWRVASIFQEKPGGFFEAAAGVQQEIVFAGDFDAHAEIVVGFQVVDNHVGEVMDVDDDFADPKGAQAGESDFEQCAASDFDEGLGARVGERA